MKTTNFFSALTLIMILAGCTQTNESPVISMDHSWRFKPGDDLSWAECDINDSSWALISPHKPWERQGYKGVNGYAWYRCKVIIPSALKEGGYFHDTLQISLGKIDDCDQVFLNGKLIGENTEGTDVRSFTIEVGDLISLTPPMGWNSWNC